MRAWLVLLAIAAGCYGNPVQSCPNVICPLGTVCDNHDGCALREQLDACEAKPDGTACSYPGVPNGECSSDLCVPQGCGNGIITSDEVCDDGNTNNGDGCSADCRSLETCGNGIVDPAKGEQCDGTSNCRDNCIEKRCGDGTPDLPFEACDDGPDNSDTNPGACRLNCQLARCGDNITDPGEVCDDGNTVSGDMCSADCKSKEECGDGILNIERGETCDCGNDAVTPPASCNGKRNSDSDSSAPCRANCQLRRCNDGHREDPEQCEGTDLNNRRCEDLGFYGGNLACTEFCTFDTNDCAGKCGDGQLNGPEQCDGTVFNNPKPTCQDFGFQQGTITCTPGCGIDTSGCSGKCGDNSLGGIEQCDGGQLDGKGCRDFGFYGGTLECSQFCGFDTSQCEGTCGDSIVQTSENEQCDSNNMNGATCASFGFYFGATVCTFGCTVSIAGCNGFCGDNQKNGPEVCDRTETGFDFGSPTVTCPTVDPKAIGPQSLLRCNGCDKIDTSNCAHLDDDKCDTDKGESCMNSIKDCKGDEVFCCGNGVCSPAETTDSCPADCVK